MSTDLFVIVDENSDAFSYSWSGGNTTSPWDMGAISQWYGGTIRYPQSTATRIGLFNFTFNGTSAAFTGNTPPVTSPQNATVQIDNGTPFVINYQDPSPQHYIQWFITPTLSDGSHTITMSNLYTTAVDYAVVKVGNQTSSLSSQTVIVDDDSPLIQYSGQWSRSTNTFIPSNVKAGYPYGNLTHRSSNPGDTFTFQFSGTSIAVYGIFSWSILGSLTTSYTLDGVVYSSPFTVTTSTPDYVNKVGELSNHVYFNRNNLLPGTHTLLVNITEANNKTFILDFITYTPSFDTLSSMPSLSPNFTTISNKPSATSSASSTGISGGPRHLTGAIVGGTLGGLAFGVLVTILIILLKRRRRRAQKEEHSSSYQDTTLNTSENYSNYPHVAGFQLQEPSSNFSGPTNLNRPAKYASIHGSSNPANTPTTDADPPSYDDRI